MPTFSYEAQDLRAFSPPAIGSQVTPAQAFQLAVDAARAGLGFVSPNPLVGAAAVDAQHRYLGYGAHLKYGEAHAEINLLNQLQEQNLTDKLRGGTLYVTLEPCAHKGKAGKTGSCAEALKNLGIAKVVYGALDPNPLVNGKGVSVLKAAGVECEVFAGGEAESAKLLEIFAWNQSKQAPFVGLKVAVSLDESLSFKGDRNRAITKTRAKTYGHYLRIMYDGIAIGQNTLILDNPELSARHPNLRNRNPKCIVLDPDLKGLSARPLSEANLFKNRAPSEVLWFVSQDYAQDEKLTALKKLGADIVLLKPNQQNHFAAKDILDTCYERGIFSLLLEGGAGLYAGFLQAGLVNRLYLFQSPQVFAGPNRQPWYLDESADSIRELKDITITPLADDWLVEGRF